MAKSTALTRLRVVSKVAHTNRVPGTVRKPKKRKKAVTFNVRPNARPGVTAFDTLLFIVVIWFSGAMILPRAHGVTMFWFRCKSFYGLSVPPIHPLISVYELLYKHPNRVVCLDVIAILLKQTQCTPSLVFKTPGVFGNRLVITEIVCSKTAFLFADESCFEHVNITLH